MLGVTASAEDEFLVLQAALGKLVVYQVGSPHDSLGAGFLIRSAPLGADVPAKPFQEAATRADVQKLDQYAEVPLDETD